MGNADYRSKVEQTNATNLRRSREGRDIADEYPDPADSSRRLACAKSLRQFAEQYFPSRFPLKWSPDHLRVIDRLEAVILHGGLFALAMPRGMGKTTICEVAALWAVLYKHRRFVCLLGATEGKAADLLDHIKSELLYNDELLADFRHVCYPIRRVENNARKCNGQLFRGERTDIEWSASHLILPRMPDDACDGPNVSGSVITVAGLTGAIRGQSHALPDGQIIRPELVVMDDPQTRESAMSQSQSAERAAIISGDVLGMSGPTMKIAAIMTCTVIREGDMADTILNREMNPHWQGERTKMVYSWPVAEDLWDQYRKVREHCLREKAGDIGEANEFYKAKRKAMDAGASVSWPQRFNGDEISAVQHAMNLRYDRGDEAFFAEYQNEPIRPEDDGLVRLRVDDVRGKVNGIARGVAPVHANHLTAFIDVHDNLLFWSVCAWGEGFTGWMLDYGTFPDQKRRTFTLRKAAKTMPMLYPRTGREGAIRAGLSDLVDMLGPRQWKREDGATMQVERCLVDAGYVPDVVMDVCRHSPHSAILMPSKGTGVGAKNKPMTDYQRKPGEKFGWNWIIAKNRSGVRYIRFDANHWKSFAQSRILTALGDSGCFSLYGRKGEDHELLADHVTAEAPTPVTANGRTVHEWSMKAGKADNHWFDCLVGCAVAASVLGVTLKESESASKPEKKRVRWSEVQRQKRLAAAR